MGTVVPSIAGPKRPQDRITLDTAKSTISSLIETIQKERGEERQVSVTNEGETFQLTDGAVVIAAITSCTNTSNPAVMLGAGLLAKRAHERGLKVKPWVKTSLGPGSKVVSDYLAKAGLMSSLEALGFHIVGYGCTTCIGNSGPLPEPVRDGIRAGDLVACSILSGNRNFEGRIHAEVKMNFLASPPLVVAYAIAGRMDVDVYNDPLANDRDGNPVFLKDIWPSQKEIQETITNIIDSSMFRSSYDDVYTGDQRWAEIGVTESQQYNWDADSTYIKNPPYFDDMSHAVAEVSDIKCARALALLGDSITTDHISPAGAIKADSPAGEYLVARGVQPADFNSYGSRRGNHEVMMRGTFANIRLRNQLAPGTEGGWTRHQPSNEQMSIYDASMRYQAEGVPLIVIGGKEYGSGSSRDWAAKGTNLLGVKAVLVESFERIHRSNLVGMGVLPLQFLPGESANSHGLKGTEVFDVNGLSVGSSAVTVIATGSDGATTTIKARVRIDTPKEWDYFRHGGILHFVLRQLAA